MTAASAETLLILDIVLSVFAVSGISMSLTRTHFSTSIKDSIRKIMLKGDGSGAKLWSALIKLFDCPWCMSFWVSIYMASQLAETYGGTVHTVFLATFALMAAAGLINNTISALNTISKITTR